MDRPYPPSELFASSLEALFLPAPDLLAWAVGTFIDEGSTLENPDHEHLQQARLGFLWTNEPNERRGRAIWGTCQLLPPTGDKWAAGKASAQLREWFGEVPDFLITIYAPAAEAMDDASFCALVYHELLHAGQKHDRYGAPVFNEETGKPVWAIRGHDVEQFVSVVRMFGARAAGVEEMVQAALAAPAASDSDIQIACGTCLR